MAPLKEISVLTPEEWVKISKSHPPRGIRREPDSEVSVALENALKGTATRLTYDRPDESYEVANKIRHRGRGRVRVVQTEYVAGDHVTIVAGPTEE